MNWERFIGRLFCAAGPYLEARGDMLHTRVAHRLSLSLMNREGGDRYVIEPAVILHDVGWSRVLKSRIHSAYGVRAAGEEAARLNRIHEVEGASIARKILEELDYDAGLTEKITSIIQRHDSGEGALSVEERVVRDADTLWRFCRVGFWNEVERQGLSPAELYRFLCLKHPGWFFTRSALEMAAEELQRRSKEIPPAD